MNQINKLLALSILTQCINLNNMFYNYLFWYRLEHQYWLKQPNNSCYSWDNSIFYLVRFL